jgi:hypothetical protein
VPRVGTPPSDLAGERFTDRDHGIAIVRAIWHQVPNVMSPSRADGDPWPDGLTTASGAASAIIYVIQLLAWSTPVLYSCHAVRGSSWTEKRRVMNSR